MTRTGNTIGFDGEQNHVNPLIVAADIGSALLHNIRYTAAILNINSSFEPTSKQRDAFSTGPLSIKAILAEARNPQSALEQPETIEG